MRLEEMREKHSLQDRVEMLGAVQHSQVRSVLITGHIFLNRYPLSSFILTVVIYLENNFCNLFNGLCENLNCWESGSLV